MLFIAIFDNLLLERRSGSKGVEMLTGLPISVYWITTAFVDYMFYLYIVVHITMLFFLMETIKGGSLQYKMQDLYDVLFFYGIAQYFFVAALSQAITKSYMPDPWIIMLAINAVSVRMYHLQYFVMTVKPATDVLIDSLLATWIHITTRPEWPSESLGDFLVG